MTPTTRQTTVIDLARRSGRQCRAGASVISRELADG